MNFQQILGEFKTELQKQSKSSSEIEKETSEWLARVENFYNLQKNMDILQDDRISQETDKLKQRDINISAISDLISKINSSFFNTQTPKDSSYDVTKVKLEKKFFSDSAIPKFIPEPMILQNKPEKEATSQPSINQTSSKGEEKFNFVGPEALISYRTPIDESGISKNYPIFPYAEELLMSARVFRQKWLESLEGKALSAIQ